MTDKNRHAYSNLPDLIDNLKPHDHLCLIYESREEWLATVVPFILSGLKRGEKCIYIVDVNTASQIKEILKETGLAVDDYESKGQLSIIHERDAYTREGYFDPDLIIALLIEETKNAINEGYPALRVTGEMSWALRNYSGVEKVLEYEAKLNRDLFPHYPCLAICQYDRWKFEPEIIKGVVLTHPLLIRGGHIYHNYYYIEPDEYLNHKKGEIEVQCWLNNLERERKSQENLRESEEKHRRLFETMDQGVIYQAADGRITSANPAAEKILGSTLAQMQGKTSLDPRWQMIEEDSTPVPGTEHPTMIALRTGQTVGPVTRGIYRPDLDRHIWLNITAIPLFHPGDKVPFQAYATFTDITEQKQAAEEIIKRDATLQKIFDLLPVGLWFADEKGKLLRGNPEGVRIWGGEPQVGQSDYGVFKAWRLPSGEEIAPDDWALAHSVNEGVTVADELLEIEDFKGQRKIVLNYTAPVFDDKGKIQGAIVVNQDITEQKEAEETIKQREAELAAIYENAPLVMMLVDKERKVQKINDYGTSFAGKPEQEMLGRRGGEALGCLNALDDPEGCGKGPHCEYCTVRLTVLETLETGLAHHQIEASLPFLMDGKEERLYFLLSTVKITLRLQQMVLVCLQDITDRKRAEEARRESDKLFVSILMHSPIGVAIVSLEGQVIEINSAMCDFFGYSYSDLKTKMVEDLSHPEDIKKDFANLRQLLAGETASYRMEKRFYHKTGQIVYGLVNVSLVRDEAGTPEYISSHLVDLTDRKKAEEEIRTLNEELEERVRERTVQLEAANRELDAFTYSASHDLRGPLNRISGFSEALLEDYANQLDPQGQDYLRRISNSSQQMGELIDDLLKLSRVSQHQVSRETVEMSALVNVHLKELQAMEPDRQVELMIKPGLVAEADTALMRIALENLLNNAWKFSAGEELSRIEFGSIVQEGKEVLYIRDNGTGFDMKHADKLFTAFQRLHDAKTYPGTGVGLSIVSRIISRHGGEIWAEGEPGKGATFYFILPQL